VPTDTLRSRTRAASSAWCKSAVASGAARFALRAVAWSLGLFGLLRLNWVETHALLPLTRLQGRLAVGLCGVPALPIDATLACSGADALALCVGVILAYPASWRMRLAGAGGGVTLVLGLNTLRIGTLGRVAASPAWFETLHVYVWPAVLTLAIAGYVLAWMRVLTGLALLELSQMATLVALHALASHSGLAPHVRDVRAWAVVGPLLLVAAVVNVDWPRRRPTPAAAAAGGGAGG